MPTLIPIVIASITVIGTIGGAWLSASASAQKEVSAVNTKVEVVQEREDNHYKELKATMDRYGSDIKQFGSDVQDIKRALNIK